jgi:hypothetical protein
MTVYIVWRRIYGDEDSQLEEIFLSRPSAEAYVKEKKEDYDLDHTIQEREAKP